MGGLAAAATAIVVVAVIASATVAAAAVAALATAPLNSGRVLVDPRAAAAIVFKNLSRLFRTMDQ